ncbi:lipopolysaccharide biosynthesis protein [Paucilactobacillus sp. N302-9]
MNSRTSNSIKNSTFAFVGQIVILLLQFASQTVFVRTLGATYVGANGLFSNLLTLLSFADLGIGGAITYSLYKPIADNNHEDIIAIMNLFKNAYHSIGSFIFFAGVVCSFFVDHFVNKNSTIPNLQVMFILFVTNSAASYFFAYLRSFLIANQQGYVDTLNRVLFTSLQTVFQIIFLILTHQYFVFLTIQIIFTISSNVALQRKTLNFFSFLKTKEKKKVPQKTVSKIKRNILGAIASRLGIVVSNGTDNLILSTYIGLNLVGKYTSYLLILNSVQNIITQAFNAVVSSIANFSILKRGVEEDDVFFKLQYLAFGAAYVISLSMYFIMQSFISIWIGKSFHLSQFTLRLLITVWFINVNRLSVQSFITAHGLYWETKWKSVAEALINLLVSLTLINLTTLGVNSVIIGTLAACVFVDIWWEPLLLFKFGLEIGKVKYMIKYSKYTLLYIVSVLVIKYTNVTSFVSQTSFFNVIIWAVISFVFFAAIFMCFNAFSKEQRFFIQLLKRKILK